jgi:vacuolar-type H+-ATPase subunit E/Vma4
VKSAGSVDSVVAAIREDAVAEVERVEQATAAELTALRAAAAEADVTIAGRAERLTEARRKNEERVAQQEWDGRRAVIEQREAWIARVVAAANFDGVDVAPLVREAQARVPGGEVVTSPDGCVVRGGDLTFDNRFEARAKRFEAEWRRALSEVYR